MKNKDDENMKNYIAKEIEERGKDAITSFCFSVFDTLVYAAKDTFPAPDSAPPEDRSPGRNGSRTAAPRAG